MEDPLTYPSTNYAPESLVDFNSVEERKRLSPASLVMFFNLVNVWKVPDDEAKLLLGGITNAQFRRLKTNPKGTTLSIDQMFRVSYLLGIVKALGDLHGERLADEWVRLPNKNGLFAGRTPLEYMVAGGLPAIMSVRKLLDARCEGR